MHMVFSCGLYNHNWGAWVSLAFTKYQNSLSLTSYFEYHYYLIGMQITTCLALHINTFQMYVSQWIYDQRDLFNPCFARI